MDFSYPANSVRPRKWPQLMVIVHSSIHHLSTTTTTTTTPITNTLTQRQSRTTGGVTENIDSLRTSIMSSTLLSKSSRDKIENLPAYRSASSPVEYTMSQLPLHVNLPGNQAANFPKAFNPERALLYQRAMARSLPKKTFLSKCVTLAVFATVGAIAYHLLFIEDYGHDNVMFAEARKERLRQISLKRPLTAKEQAILDRPAIETHELVSDVSFSDLFRRMGQRFRDREEDRLARQDAYKRKIGLLDELDGTSAATVGTSDSGTGLNWQRYQRKSNVREALPEDVEWDKVKSLN